MTECPRYRKSISRDATFCPQCGYDFTPAESSESTLTRAIVAFVMILAVPILLVVLLSATCR